LIAVNCVSFTDITNATLYTLNFPATTDVNSQDRVFVIQRIFVPQNLQQIEVLAVAVTFDNTICSDPEIQIGSRGIPCAVANPDFPVIGISPCDDYAENEGGDNIFTGNSVEGGIEDFTIGTYWYLSIRKIDIEFALNCQFQVTTTISTCPTGQVGLGDDSPVVCLPLQPQIAANGTWFPVPALSTTTLIYSVNFATDQNLVRVTLNSTDFDSVSASWGIPLNFDDNFFCYSDTVSNGQIIVTCNAVPAGNFYIVLQNSLGTTSGFLQVTTTTCPTGFSGLSCASPLALFNTTTVTGTVPAHTSGNFPQDLFYFELVANTSVVWNITMTNTTGASGQLVVRAGSFSYFDTLTGTGGNGYIFQEFAPLPNALFFTPDDSYVGSKYYFSIVNTDSIPLGYIITSTYQVVTTTTGSTATGVTSTGSKTTTGSTGSTGATGATTGATSTGATTGAKVTTGSNANSLFAPILLLASLILALL